MAKGNKSREKKCLALDLDNTLIFAKKIERNPKKAMIKKDKYCIYAKSKNGNEYEIKERPFLSIFLKHLKKLYKLVIFTSAKKEYCEMILKSIHKKKYFNKIFSRENMIRNKKRLNLIAEKLKLPKKKIIFIDDNQEFVHREDIPNSLKISSFKGDKNDYALPIITAKLIMISEYEDVKEGIKRLDNPTKDDDEIIKQILQAIPYSAFNINK